MSLICNEQISQNQFVENLQEQYSNYSNALKTQLPSAHARRAQRSRLSQFISFLSHSKLNYATANPERQAKDAAVSNYLDYLQYFLKARPSTINKALATIGEFYEYIGLEPISIVRDELPGANPQALSNEQVQKFLLAAEANTSIKHKSLALLLGTTGIRPIDCTMLNIDDYNASTGTLCIHGNDMSTPRAVTLNAPTQLALEQWLQQRRQRFTRLNEKALFLNPQRRRISQAGVNLVIRKISMEAGLDLSAQQLRDTYLVENAQTNNADDAEETASQTNRAVI
ncbi:MAG: tyrosine-type recombinase/integrase [Candidatus Melainabacteria bacterium]|nr:tyrosine-type recombinase/integrase [Candidatus Melainabacteria bacterium]